MPNAYYNDGVRSQEAAAVLADEEALDQIAEAVLARGGGGGVNAEGVQDTVAGMFAGGVHENVTVTYDDVSGTLSLMVAGGGEGGLTQEQIEDLVALMVGGTHSGIAFVYDDASGTLTATVSGFQPTDATLSALASLDTTAGIVEQTGADTFSKRPFGVGGATSVPTRADADGRYAALVHGHAQAEVTGLVAALAAKLDDTERGAVNGVAPLDGSGKVPAAYIEVLPSEDPPVFPAGGTIPSLTAGEQAQIEAGTVVVQSNGQRYMYTGTGSKIGPSSYVLLSDLSPSWFELTDVPATFPPSAHGHPQADVTGLTAALAAKAPLDSPALTGVPTAPTPTVGDATNKLATTGFVTTAVGAGGFATPNKQVRSGAITTVLTTGELVLGSATAALTGRHGASEVRVWGAVSIQKTAAAASTWTVRVRRGTTTAGTLIATATATSTVSGNACVIPVEGFDPLGAATGQYVVTVQASVANATATYYQLTALEVGGAPGPAGPQGAAGATMGFTVSAAVGNGIVDDGPVIKAEIEALAALPQGGALMLSPGKTYLVGTITLTSLSKVHIWGGFAPADNRGNAKLKLKPYVGSTTACHRQCPLVMISCTDMQITGVDLDGSRGEHPGFVGSAVMHSDFGNGSMNALSLISCQRFRADRVGMVNSNTDGLWITGKRTWTPYTAGDSSPPSSELTFVDCVMNRNGRLGMIAITCRRATWVRCNFDDNGDVTVQPDGPGCGIDLETDVGLEDASIGGTWQAPDDLNFEDCTWRRNGSGGFIHSNRHGNRAGRLSIRNCRGSGNGRFISASFNSLDIQIFALPETVGTNVNAEVYSVEIVGGSYRSQGIYIGTFDTSNTRQERFHVLVQNVQLGGRAGVVCKQGRGNVDVIGCRSDRLTVVISSVQTTPPASPTHGDLFIKPAGATGVWSGFPTGHLLAYNGDAAAWGASCPSDGDIVYSLDHGSGANTWLVYHEKPAGAHVVGSAAAAGWETFAAFLSPLDKIKVQSWWDGTIRISGNELEATGASHACIYVSAPSACATDVYVENNICENTTKKLLGGPFATGDTGHRGIRYDGNYRDVEFAGNYLLNCGTGLDLTGTGTTRILVKGNRYKGNTTPQVIAAGLPITVFEGERFIEGTADPDLPAVSGGGGAVTAEAVAAVMPSIIDGGSRIMVPVDVLGTGSRGDHIQDFTRDILACDVMRYIDPAKRANIRSQVGAECRADVQKILDNEQYVFFRRGQYQIDGTLSWKNGQYLVGAGPTASILNEIGGGADLIASVATGGGVTMGALRDLFLQAVPGAGHVLRVDGGALNGMGQCLISGCRLNQLGDSKSVIYCTGLFIDNLIEHCDIIHTLTATVPTVLLYGDGHWFNINLWRRLRFTYSGNYSIQFINNGLSTYVTQNTFDQINFEITNGGCMDLAGCKGFTLRDIGVYDLTTTTKDLFKLRRGNNGVTANAGVNSLSNTLDNVWRVGGTLGSGLYDFVVDGSYGVTHSVWSRVAHAGMAGKLNANNQKLRITGIDAADLTITNGTNVTVVSEG